MTSNSLNLLTIIPSRGRADSLRKGALGLFPDAFVIVDYSEYDEYAKVVPEPQLFIHEGLSGLPAIRNYIVDKFGGGWDGIAMVDDDVYGVRSRTGQVAHSYRDPDVAKAVLYNSFQICHDLSIPAFSYQLYTSIIGFRPHDFISFKKLLSTVVGVVPNISPVRWDERFRINGDVDATLQHLMEDRIIYIDTRFEFEPPGIFKGRGGNAIFRTSERIKENRAMLKRKWGRHVSFSSNKGTFRTHIRVNRRNTK